MKILMLTHRVPWPLQSGDRIRTFNFFNYLSAKHDVALLSIADTPSAVYEHRQHLQTRAKLIEVVPLDYQFARARGALALFSRGAISVKAFDSVRLGAAFRRLVDSFQPDLVFTDSSALTQYPMRMNLPFIADFMDVDSEKWRQISRYSPWPLNWLYAREQGRLAQFEKEAAEKANSVLVVSETEKARLAALAPDAKITVIPNGVDRTVFHVADTTPIPGRVTFIGVMNYFPNVDGVRWFCREIWPAVTRKVPQATFYIVGADPSRAVRRLGRLPGVVVTGSVMDIRPYLSQAELCVAPLRFSIGLQNKVIQSMAMGRAVVATSGAVQGLAQPPQGAARVADGAKAFAAAVVELLQNADARKKLEKAGPEFVVRHHDWNRNLDALKRIV